MGWLQRQLGSLAQNCIGGILSSVLLVGGGATLVAIDGCPQSVRNDVVQGETKLLGGDAVASSRIAADAVAASPRCSCAQTLMAQANLQLMRAARAHGDLEASERFRQVCYASALKARSLFGVSPLVQALRTACKAPE